jgi:hypothetical protein
LRVKGAGGWERTTASAKARWPEITLEGNRVHCHGDNVSFDLWINRKYHGRVITEGIRAMRQWTIDAFASGPFKGNPACVVEPFDAWPSTPWMQALAAENNQAETSFLLKTADPARFGLRWFTPALEAPLCGHATLAAAHALFEELGVEASRC